MSLRFPNPWKGERFEVVPPPKPQVEKQPEAPKPKVTPVALLTQWAVLKDAGRAINDAKNAVTAACEKEADERAKYVDMLAESLNLSIGMHVTQSGSLYEVTRFSLSGPSGLRLHGCPVRKNGNVGKVEVEIAPNWKRA
jgi:hypothetical protein